MRNQSRAEHLGAWLCGLGILLGCGGVWAMRHVPLILEEEENERKLQRETIPTAEEIARQSQRPPPYRTQGIVALAAGIGSFAAGVLIWIRYSGRWRRSRWVKLNEDV